jgi:Mlc titration factor MtfA (ptsG expression regulator)
VYVVNSLVVDKYSIGGTTLSNDTIFLVHGDIDYTESTFHHEFCHALDSRYALDKMTFLDFDKDVKYKGYKYEIKTALSYELDEKCAKEGFLNEYAMSDVGEDIAVTAENLFMGNKDLWRFYDKYPLVKKKTDYIITFYNKLDKSFTKDYFKSLVQKDFSLIDWINQVLN